MQWNNRESNPRSDIIQYASSGLEPDCTSSVHLERRPLSLTSVSAKMKSSRSSGEGICYKVAGSRPHEVNEFFSIHQIFQAALGSGVHSASNRNEYQKHKNNVSGEWSAAGT
jgi:hypothetical protein